MTARVKICGITRIEDAKKAIKYGADALGFNFYPKSPRSLDIEGARHLVAQLPPFGLRVGVFVDASFEEIKEAVKVLCLDTVQLHGSEPPEIAEDLSEEGLRVWKAIRVESEKTIQAYSDYPCDAFVLDAFEPGSPGGTGKTFDWEAISEWKPEKPWILSGGLTPDNVAEAIQRLKPNGVDVASGVESQAGIKDGRLVKTFIQGAKQELALV